MSDNTLIPPGSIGGDTIRDIDRNASGLKTQVVQLDFGGSAANAEQLASASNALPVLANSVADRVKIALLLQQTLLLAGQPANGFVPIEIPTFLGAL